MKIFHNTILIEIDILTEFTQFYWQINGKVSKYNQERENSTATSRFSLLDPTKVSSDMIFFAML